MSQKKGNLLWSKVNCDLSPWILDAVAAEGFENMTPVQASTIPLFSGNKDVVVEAVTGSGKTISFVIPILQRLCRATDFKRGHVFAMVIAPTRELAIQINNVFESILKYYPEDEEIQKQMGIPKDIKTQQIVGSLTSFQEDMQTFMEEKPQILVGTPGKLAEFISSSAIIKKTKDFDCLVLDEADRLLDISFEATIREIVRKLPRQKRIGLFSATISSAGDMIFKIGMANPVKIAVKSSNTMNAAPKTLSINYLVVKPDDKIKMLFNLLSSLDFKKTIIYFPTCVSVNYFYAMFCHLLHQASEKTQSELKFFSIHGKLQLKARVKTLENFAANAKTDKSILMATDVAARGIDIPDVDLVIQMDPPTDPDVFLHRCGRTGRANKVGKAIVLLNEGREEDYLEFMRVKKVDMGNFSDMHPEVDLSKLDLNLSMAYGFKNRLDKIVERWILEDRSRYDLSVRSYVGFVRYYSKHSALSIFRLETFDYIGMAKAYGLIRLPRMPETKYIDDAKLEEFKDGWLIKKQINLDEFKYLNEQKEAARLEELKNTTKKEQEKLKRKEMKKLNEAWSNKTNARESRDTRREKMKRKREAIEKEIAAQKGSDDSDEDIQEDWKDIVRSKKKKKQGAVMGNFDGL
ncbi:putative ATP-dependent RNA helicase [Saccharomycopsis crataegensis]|uniref:ATP-dependent RNA helicase n=1 Tax=Saccharomycopsis crataegensis TaxID=43959 RepID=A0AAV5QL55_9ASCO|nr:putative ATP-dependent RNA helicase [Saccharomycopsis crataegensis]